MLRHKWLRSRLTNWLPERGAEDVLVEAPAKWQVRRFAEDWSDVWGVWQPGADPYADEPLVKFLVHENAVQYANTRAAR